MIEKKENIDIMNQIRSWFSANNLIKNIPFFLLITALGILYIANAHYHLQLERRIDKKEAVLKQLSWEYMTLKSQVMFESKQSEVSKKVEKIGLEPLTVPPKIIVVKK